VRVRAAVLHTHAGLRGGASGLGLSLAALRRQGPWQGPPAMSLERVRTVFGK
jgi:hypothetical protein